MRTISTIILGLAMACNPVESGPDADEVRLEVPDDVTVSEPRSCGAGYTLMEDSQERYSVFNERYDEWYVCMQDADAGDGLECPQGWRGPLVSVINTYTCETDGKVTAPDFECSEGYEYEGTHVVDAVDPYYGQDETRPFTFIRCNQQVPERHPCAEGFDRYVINHSHHILCSR